MYKITHIKLIGLVGYAGGSMKISTKGRYGLRALVDLAVYSQGEPTALAMVAARQKISLNYLVNEYRSYQDSQDMMYYI